MQYVSTRTGEPGPGFCDILLEGLAPDGGLYVPEVYPRLTPETLATWRRTLAADGYAGLAFEVLRLFADDIPADDLRAICERAYASGAFSTPDVVTVTQVDEELYLGHLSNGPTAAFKDMAMQLLGELFDYELGRRHADLNVLGATSGDTGSSAEYAMIGKHNVRVFMLTPAGRMTPFQQAQMFGLDEPNIINIAIDGVFDDCQDLVKAINADAGFKAEHRLGAVNSINFARLVAQVVYYVALWLRVTTRDDQRVSFCVPTGNFGNICAGHIAREMGLPIETLVLATNENNVLDEFFRTGVYRVRSSSETLATSSPSMDISKASNFERFIFDLMGRDADVVAELFGRRLDVDGYFDLSTTPEFAGLRERFGFESGTSSHADRVAMIRELWSSAEILIDPHTADGVQVAQAFVQVGVPMLVLETALPVKFAETITEAVGLVPEVPERFVGLLDRPRHVIDLPNEIGPLKALIRDRDIQA